MANYKYPPIFETVWGGNAKELTNLLKSGEEINSCDRDGRTPLMHAIIDKRMDIVRILIDHGADVNIQDNLGWTALHFAAQNNDIENSRILIKSGSKIDAQDENGNTALWRAVFNSHGQGELIKLLLSHGADKNKKNNHGISPLDLATDSSDEEDVKLFE